MKVEHAFDYERLDVYRLAVEVNRWMGRAVFPRGRAALRDQGLRAADAMVCNIAEGTCKRNGAGKNAMLIALGEAGECCAVLDCVDLVGAQEQQAKLRRVGAMLAKMSR
ncbi:MAG: four helix bundle protein [Deltaproteobacteria bacterium]|nr:four helix bundle protein [Deltaproteobacteria bacterium]